MRAVSENGILLDPIESKRSSEAIFEQIRGKIMSGEIRPGDRLPSERAMMDMLEKSRPTIREALRMLECAGLVRIIPGSGGAMVIEPSNATLEQPLESMLTLGQIENRELLEYRELNEVAAAGWAARRRTEADMRAIRASIEGLRYVKNDFTRFAEQDLAFHQAIASAGHNRLAGIVDRVVHGLVLNLLSEAYIQKSAKARRDMMESILRSHTGIADAIEQSDENLARENMQAHIRMFETDIIN